MPILTVDDKTFGWVCDWCGELWQKTICLDTAKDLLVEHEQRCRARSTSREDARARRFLEEHSYDFLDEDVYALSELLRGEQNVGWRAARVQANAELKEFFESFTRNTYPPVPEKEPK